MQAIQYAEPDASGRARLINPDSGRAVLADGRVGRRVIESYEAFQAAQQEMPALPPLIPRELKTAPRELGVAAPIKLVNPKTGNAVLRSGATGKAILREHKQQLIATGQMLPRKTGTMKAKPASVVDSQTYNNRRVVPGQADRHGAYRRQTYEVKGAPPNSIDEWAATIAAKIKTTANYVQTAVVFKSPNGDTVARTLHGKTRRELSAEIERISLGVVGTAEQAGSDVIGDDYEPVTSSFTLGSVVYPVGGTRRPFKGIRFNAGTRHPHFKLVELSADAAPGDCLLAVLRKVAKSYGIGVGRVRNATIRANLDLPDGDLPASPEVIERVARYFKLRVRVITGMAVPDEADRVYIDGKIAGEAKTVNRCQTVAEEVVIASGGAPDDPQCDVYLADNHYQYIHHVLEPIRTCAVTGDLLVDGKEYTSREAKRRVLEQGRVWYNGYQRTRKRARETPLIEKLIVFDYETTYDSNGDLRAYGLGYLIFDPTHDADFSQEGDNVVQCYDTGMDRHAVTRPLLEELARAPENVRYTLVSFNGVRFDHFLLAAAAHAKGVLSKVFATSQGLRAVHIGRHTTLDIAKIIPGTSLAKACKSFKTSPSKIDGFSHQLPQSAYEREELGEWLAANRLEVAEYLAHDVLSTASLLQLVNGALKELTGYDCYGPKALGTIGGHAWKLMCSFENMPEAVRDEATDKWIRGAIIGGRTQVFRKPGTPAGPRVVEGKQSMVDFASLYPTVMAAVPKAAAVFPKEWLWGYFPFEGQPTDRVLDYTPGDVGLFDVTIVSQPWPTVIPLRSEDGSLDWDYRGEFKATITHIDIQLIREGGGIVNVIEGKIWTGVAQGLFRDFILPLAAKKDEEDAKKAAGLPNNPAMRECYKLLQNSASGKCCQSNYEEVTVMATGSAHQLKAMNAMDQERPITWYALGGESCLITGYKPAAKIYKAARAKPSILAVLIYSYSRALLYRVCCAGGDILYCDTDSALYRAADVAKVRAAYPDLDPTNRRKTLGDLEEELPTHENAVSYLIAPKDYSVFCFADEKMESPLKPKLRMKGVNQRSDRLVTAEVAAELATKTLYEQAAEYNGGDNSRPLSDPAVMREFFQRRAKQEKLTVLCSQLTRSYKNEMNPYSLKQRYLIKNV